MNEELERLRVVMEAELAPYKKQMEAITKETRVMSTRVDRETSKVTNSFKKMGSVIKTVIAGIAIKKMFDVGKQSLEMASDVEETEAVIELAFGNMRKYVDDFAKTAIKTHGMSSLQAKQTAGDYMLMSKGMGMADENAAKMSVNVTKLSADMASLKNTSQEMAKTALNGIWTGETEALNFSAVA